WGPIEYAQAALELAPRWRPETIVFVANVANDWVEASVPNSKRSDARDGWLIRKRSDAPAPLDFPGREAFFGSHLVFAIRELRALAGSPALDALPGATAAERLLRDLPALSKGRGGYRSRVTPELARVVERCAALRCRVVAATLPLDAEVDPAEW